MRTFTISWEVDGASGSSDVEALSPLFALYRFYETFYNYTFVWMTEGNRSYGPIRWTGGERPRKWLETRKDAYNSGYLETLLCRDLFRQDCIKYVEFWGDLPLANARTLWTDARYRAFATIQALRRDTR